MKTGDHTRRFGQGINRVPVQDHFLRLNFETTICDYKKFKVSVRKRSIGSNKY